MEKTRGQSLQEARLVTADWYRSASIQLLKKLTEQHGEWGDGVDISAYCSKTGLAVVQIRNQPTTTFYPIGEDSQEIKNARLTDVELVYNGKDHFEYSKSNNYLLFVNAEDE